MSLKKRFEAMAADLPVEAPPKSKPAASAPAADRPLRASTAPGIAFMAGELRKDADKEIIQLKEELAKASSLNAQFEQAYPTRRIDPTRIRPSSLANRLEESFRTESFEEFRREIASSGGNIEAIWVRPVQGDPDCDYEIVFGHRRHRACKELGLPVLAMIRPATDVELFLAMERENRSRKDLTPYETGLHYARALDTGLWPSVRAMSSALNVSRALVDFSLNLARLPQEVVDAFPSPLRLQFRWGGLLQKALEADRDRVIERAKALAALKPKRTASEVLAALLGEASIPKATETLVAHGRTIGTVRTTSRTVNVTINRRYVDNDDVNRALKALKAALKSS